MKKYRGNDRNMIKKGLQVLNAIKKRDLLAGTTSKKTTRLSTRFLILDGNVSSPGLLAAAEQLIANFVARLAENAA